MNDFALKLWWLWVEPRLGVKGMIPIPQWFLNVYSKYPMQYRIMKYCMVLEGEKVYRHVPQEVGCANAVTGILEMVDPSFFGSDNTEDRIDSTIKLNAEMFSSDRFIKLNNPINGSVVINPTEGTNIGHCGIYVNGWIYNNNSKTGEWLPSYTWEEWVEYFEDTKKLQTRIYFPLAN